MTPRPQATRCPACRWAAGPASAVVTLVLLFSPAAVPAAQDWSTFRGAGGIGAVSSGRSAPPLGLRLGWKRAIGSGYSGITSVGDLVVTCAAQDGRDVLIALDAESGETRWTADLGEMHPGLGGSLDGAIATPAAADGVVYAFGPRGRFVAVDADDGALRWSRELAGPDATVEATVPYYGFASSPLVVGDLVVVQVGGEAGTVIAMERGSGEIAWRTGSSAVEAQSPMLAEIGGRAQLVVASNDWVGGLDPEEGTLLWSWPYQSDAAFVLTNSPLPLPDGRIFWTATNERGVLLRPPALPSSGSQLPAAAEVGVEVEWEANALTRTYSPAALIGNALVGYTSRFFAAYSADDGGLLWRSRSPGDGFLIGVDGRAVVVTKSGSLHLGEVEGGWNELATLELFDELVWTPPSYRAADDAVFVRSMTEIARVDLERQGLEQAPRITDLQPRRDEAHEETAADPVPPALADLAASLAAGATAGDRADLAPRVDQLRLDQFLEGVETPLLREGRALFLWRGEAADVGIAGDFLGMRREAPLRRLEGTDLWWYETAIDPRLQYSYFLSVDAEPTLDPLNPRTAAATIWGFDANWVREPVEMSWFAGPEWPGPVEHLRADAAPPATRGSTERIEIAAEDLDPETRERLGGRAAEAWVWLPPGDGSSTGSERRHPTVYVLDWPGLPDGDVSRFPDVLDHGADRLFEAPIVVFLGQPMPMTRGLVESIDRRYRTDPRRERRALIGWAWASNDVLEGVAELSDLFGRFAVQSYFGFFGDEVERAVEAMAGAVSAGASVTGYMDWGLLETRSPSEGWDMGESSRRVFEQVAALGVEMTGGEVLDTSDWKSWRNRTHLLLGALFPPVPGSDPGAP